MPSFSECLSTIECIKENLQDNQLLNAAFDLGVLYADIHMLKEKEKGNDQNDHSLNLN